MRNLYVLPTWDWISAVAALLTFAVSTLIHAKTHGVTRHWIFIHVTHAIAGIFLFALGNTSGIGMFALAMSIVPPWGPGWWYIFHGFMFSAFCGTATGLVATTEKHFSPKIIRAGLVGAATLLISDCLSLAIEGTLPRAASFSLGLVVIAILMAGVTAGIILACISFVIEPGPDRVSFAQEAKRVLVDIRARLLPPQEEEAFPIAATSRVERVQASTLFVMMTIVVLASIGVLAHTFEVDTRWIWATLILAVAQLLFLRFSIRHDRCWRILGIIGCFGLGYIVIGFILIVVLHGGFNGWLDLPIYNILIIYVVPLRGGVLLHPGAVGAGLPDDLAREVHQADLVLLLPIDEPPFAELPLNAYSAILKVEVDPLQPKAFAQPEAGPQRNQEEKEVARACTRGVQKSGLVLRGKRRDPLLLVNRLVQQLAEPDGGILHRQTAIVDQPLVRLLDRSQNVSAEALAGLCSEQPFEGHLEVLTPKDCNSIADAIADLGRPEEISKVFAGFQKYLYQAAASGERMGLAIS
jgi:hypothetical protein